VIRSFNEVHQAYALFLHFIKFKISYILFWFS